MIATDEQGRKWFVDDGVLEPLGHNTDPESLSRGEENFIYAQMPKPVAPDLGEDNWGWRYDQARDRLEELRCR